jgi:VWFA-related protein
MGRLLIASIASILMTGLIGHAQQQTSSASGRAGQPDVTFKADVNFVEVHAVVNDAQGNPVQDLTKEDFEILEDGKLQTPTVFSLVDLPIERPLMPAFSSQSVEPDVRSSVRSFDGRFYVLVLDDLHTTTLRSQLVRDAAKRFVQHYIGTNDLAAVVHTSGREDAAQELTGSRRLLLAAVDKFQGQKLPSTTAEKLAVHLRDVDRARATESGDGSSSSQNSRDPISDPYDAERGFNARRALELVKNVAAWMSDVHGRRKSLIFFSEGIDYDIYDVFNNRSASSLIQDARDAVAAAQRANVGIYAVDPRGLTQLADETIAIASLSDNPQVHEGSPMAFQRELLLAQESLIALAEETGGRAVVRTNDIAGGLARIARENSTYYLLGYQTDASRAPGKFRKIEVRVRRPGLEVRARRGYIPPDPKTLANSRKAEAKAGTSPALRAALNNPLPVGDLPIRVFATPLKGTGRNSSVMMAVEIDAKGLRFDERDGRFTDKLELSIIAVDYQGKVRGTDRRTLDLKLKPESYQKIAKTGGVRLLARLDLPPSRYQIRVGVHETGGNVIGSLPYDLEVPDYTKTPFVLSGPLMTSTGVGAAFITPKPDTDLQQLLPAPPIATRVFSPEETIAFASELYDNSNRSAHSVDFAATVRRVSDGRVVFEMRDQRTVAAGDSSRTEGYRGEIALKDFAPGAYVLRVEATSPPGTQISFREVPFEVRRAGSPVTTN